MMSLLKARIQNLILAKTPFRVLFTNRYAPGDRGPAGWWLVAMFPSRRIAGPYGSSLEAAMKAKELLGGGGKLAHVLMFCPSDPGNRELIDLNAFIKGRLCL